MWSSVGSLYSSVTNKSLSFILNGNFCMSIDWFKQRTFINCSAGGKTIKKWLFSSAHLCNKCFRCCSLAIGMIQLCRTIKSGTNLGFANVASSHAKHRFSPTRIAPQAGCQWRTNTRHAHVNWKCQHRFYYRHQTLATIESGCHRRLRPFCFVFSRLRSRNSP